MPIRARPLIISRQTSDKPAPVVYNKEVWRFACAFAVFLCGEGAFFVVKRGGRGCTSVFDEAVNKEAFVFE